MKHSNLIVTAIIMVIGIIINLAMFDTLANATNDPERMAWVCIILWSAAIVFYTTYLPLSIFENKGTV